jgi:phage head maturation protease
MHKIELFGTLQKIDADQRVVSGYASTEAVDSAGEIVLKSAIRAALPDYLKWANIREMQANVAVGVAEDAFVDERGLYIVAKISDDGAWSKVRAGVYKGFSVGGKVLGRDPKSRKTITKISLHEISLVDRPRNTEARFDLWKAAGAPTIEDVLAALSVEERATILTKAALKLPISTAKWGI